MKLKSLHIYPVKSCRGLALNEMKISERGPQHDREWMITDETGQFLTQRQLPRLALIETGLTDKALTLQTEGHDTIAVPLEITNSRVKEATKAVVWSDPCDVIDEGTEVAQWLSSFLEREVRLVRMAPAFTRNLKEKYGRPDRHTAFVDSMPILITSMASLSELNSRLAQPVSMDRFRANLVIDGDGPYTEDGWSHIKIGEIEMHSPKPCTRCTIITIDQASGVSGKEPLKTLSTYRKVAGGVAFGQYLIHLNQGFLRVGDTVEVSI